MVNEYTGISVFNSFAYNDDGSVSISMSGCAVVVVIIVFVNITVILYTP